MIGVIAPYSKFKEDVEKISAKLHVPVTVEIGALKAGLIKAKKMIKEYKVKVIIARGPTANLLKDKLDIPVIKIDVTNFDVIKTLGDAKKAYKSIHLFDHFNNQGRLEIETIKKILDVDIILNQYSDEKEINNQITEIARMNERKAIVGTAECMANTAENQGMHPFIVFSQSDSITEALLRAQETLENFEREEVKQKHLESIISLSSDGVISTDFIGTITVCNSIAADQLGVKSSEIIGRNIANIYFPLLKKLFGDYSNATKKVINNGSNKYLLNRVCLGGKSIIIMFQKADEILQMNTQIRSELYHKRFYAKYKFEDIYFKSRIMNETVSLARAYSKSESNVLIYGESGTGKELLAQGIHSESSRKNGPFIAVNCAALPENLLESELFGYEDGAFTGARKGGKPGLFEMAHEGTIFLDEIGEVSLSLQTRLLRVLQEKEVRRVGGERIIPVNVRVISATNKDLIKMIETQEFRSDLYYRLNILHINVPPLRERKEDIDLLINELLKKHNGDPALLSEDIFRVLKEYSWPGNIRELENVIERAVSVGPLFRDNILPILNLRSIKLEETDDLNSKDKISVTIAKLEEMERQIFEELMIRFDGNKAKLAEMLGISRTTLWKKLKQSEEIAIGEC
ncbi:sigma 54-interacting transcriptional regulator [Mesobacillus jeotgali]|uniref:sigma 54-interacting transcriptional regulator n=1 Tax=Mesobacillus jeotgali TaxID=129985 RepID=UPI001CFE9F14|nr:sigma 54-interacting transcriptional regulator [Mesobacillus jeotgali]